MCFVQNFLALISLFVFGLTEACAGAKPSINSDYTITVNLFTDNNCCSAPFGKTVMGNLGTCHTASQPFGSITEAVGQGMFGRNIKVWGYPDSSCSGPSVYWDISNKPECFINVYAQSYRSFKIQVLVRDKPTPNSYQSLLRYSRSQAYAISRDHKGATECGERRGKRCSNCSPTSRIGMIRDHLMSVALRINDPSIVEYFFSPCP